MARKITPEAERFWPKVDKSGECWLWQGSRSRQGYGQFAIVRDGKTTTMLAHRWAFLATGQEIPADRQLHHTCNNPACVRPDHLRVVTPQENIAAIASRTPRTPARLGRYRPQAGPSTTQAFHIPDQVLGLLNAAAAQTGCSKSYIVNAALIRFFALDDAAALVARDPAA